jgi:two-component system chemotaxis response regulator CheB
MLDDGASGLWEIANRHGITIVQDPSEAQFPSMPLNALRDAAVNYRLAASAIGKLLPRLVNEEQMPQNEDDISPEDREDRFSGFTCPECRGPLFESAAPGPVEFRCRVGHLWSLKTLVDEHTSTQERKLYEAIVALEEGADLALYTANRVEGQQQSSLRREAEQLRHYAGAIRKILEERDMPGL